MDLNKHLILTTALVILFGCSSSENTDSIESDVLFVGSRWILQSYGSDSTNVTLAIDDTAFTFAFDYTDQEEIDGFFGFDGCNTFLSEQVMLDGNSIMPVNGVNTDALSCSNLQFAEYLQQHDYFYSVISDIFSYDVADSKLILTSIAGRSLTFDPCIPTDPESLDSSCKPM